MVFLITKKDNTFASQFALVNDEAKCGITLQVWQVEIPAEYREQIMEITVYNNQDI